MLRAFQSDRLQPERTVITLEWVPGRESFGQSVDTLKEIAADAFHDSWMGISN
jgi:methylenetetrahydrofolate reductase (NADPH)